MTSLKATSLAILLSTTAAHAAPALLSAPPTGQAAAPALLSVPPLAFTHRTLASGAKLYALRDPSASTVTIYVWYGVGQRDDPVGRSGFAHLFEHLMFKQTRNLPGGVEEFLTSRGASDNATTLFDATVYYETVPANQLEPMLWVEAERLKNLVIDEDNYSAERDVVKEELRQRILGDPYGRILYSLLPAYAFSDHPYARPIGGTIAELDAAPLADVRAFHEAYYRPDNMTIAVAGNFDPAELDRWADRYIGGIARPATPIPHDHAAMKPIAKPVAVDAYAPGVPLPALVFAWHSPAAADERDVAGLSLIEAILTRGPSARLNRVLIHDRHIASNIIDYNFLTRDGHAFAVIVTLADGQDVAGAEAALAAQIAALRDAPLGADELRAAKNGLLGDALAAHETPNGRAYAVSESAELTGDGAAADRRLAAIRAMSAAEVQRIAAKWLRPEGRVTIRYRDEARRPANYTMPPGADVAAMGSHIPPASKPPVTLADDAARVAPPAAGAKVPRAVPAVAERRLGNGLRVLVTQSSAVPLTAMELAVGGGESADPAGRSGLADITAALLLRGTAHRDADAIATTIGTLGGSLAAEAQPDATVLRLNVPSANADAAGALFADVALNPVFAAGELDSERRQQLDAVTVADKRPMGVALRALPGIAFAGTRYQAVPTPASLGAIGRDDIVAGYRAAWRPSNATLVITGALTTDQGFALADRLFGGWAGSGTAPAPEPATVRAVAPAPQVVAVDLPGLAQTAVVALLPVAGRHALDYPALERANAILGGGWTGWLSKEIRVKRGLTYGAGSQLLLNRDAGVILAASRTKTASALEVADLIDAQLRRLQTEPITEATLAEREPYLAMALARRTETTANLADVLIGDVTAGVPLSDIRSELAGDADIAPTRVHEAATRFFDPARASLLLVGDSSQWIGALRKAHPEVRLISPDAIGD